MPTNASSLQQELGELTDKLEEILHAKLPEAARGVSANTPEGQALAAVVAELDEIQKALGMRTYELLRSHTAAPRGFPRAELVPLSEAPPDPIDPPPPHPPVPYSGPLCSNARCNHTAGVQTCPRCSQLFCPEHLDPALHPCAGDGD
jgi:hypothetical protein